MQISQLEIEINIQNRPIIKLGMYVEEGLTQDCVYLHLKTSCYVGFLSYKFNNIQCRISNFEKIMFTAMLCKICVFFTSLEKPCMKLQK